MTFTFREQVAQDEEFLRGLFAAAVGPALGLSAWPVEQRAALLDLQYRARERDWSERCPPGRLLIVERDGEPAGRIRFSQPEADGCRRVVDLAVAPAHRRCGVATAALAHCPGPLRLRVARTNLPARQLYQRLGFLPEGGDDLDLFLHRPAQ